jgi:ribose 5-phosphate isomerase B
VISQLGHHVGKNIVFGFDHHGLPEVDGYVRSMSEHGLVMSAVHGEQPHYLSSTQRVCERVRGRADAVGVLLCSTGMGVSIAANKFSGIYAARCLTVEDATMARQINNCNVLCLALRSGMALNTQIIDAFMTTAYEGRKLEQLSRITLLEHDQGRHDLVALEQPRVRAGLKSV